MSDDEYTTYVITDVTPYKDGGWELGLKETGHEFGPSFYCPDKGIVPEVGHEARLYGRGLGSPVRGLVINGKTVFYRTPTEDEDKRKQDLANEQAKQKADFEANRSRLDDAYAALPAVFQARLDRFRRNNADFRWQFEGYELFCCQEAIKIATALQTQEAITHFHDASWEEQQQMVPGIDEGHSGNTLGAACHLAVRYLGHPEVIDKAHGAMCPLAGCKDYGCYASEQQEVPA